MEKGFIIMDNFGGYVNTIVDMETGLAKVFSSKKEAEQYAKENKDQS